MATLRHGTDYSYFYGANAFVSAVDAAEQEDEIVLSAGYFNATNLDKSKSHLKIRGAGADPNASATEQTLIVENTYSYTEWYADSLFVEGITFVSELDYGGCGSSFVKTLFEKIYASASYGGTIHSASDCIFINCIIDYISFYYAENLRFYNSFFGVSNGGGNHSGSVFMNCVFAKDFWLRCQKSVLYDNCIFAGCDTQSIKFENVQCRNCLMMVPSDSNSGDPFWGSLSDTNHFVKTDDFTEVFKTFDGTFSKRERCELQDAAKTTYLGTDGTEIGIYGGFFPFNMNVSSAHILSKKIETSTQDGKLHVSLKLGVGENLPTGTTDK